jgi:hypothetical protein
VDLEDLEDLVVLDHLVVHVVLVALVVQQLCSHHPVAHVVPAGQLVPVVLEYLVVPVVLVVLEYLVVLVVPVALLVLVDPAVLVDPVSLVVLVDLADLHFQF